MGTIPVRIAPPGTEPSGSAPAGEERKRFRLFGSEGVVALPTEKLAASLRAIAGELNQLFGWGQARFNSSLAPLALNNLLLSTTLPIGFMEKVVLYLGGSSTSRRYHDFVSNVDR